MILTALSYAESVTIDYRAARASIFHSATELEAVALAYRVGDASYSDLVQARKTHAERMKWLAYTEARLGKGKP